MSSAPSGVLTQLSSSFGAVYPQLRAMAATMMRRERVAHTLQPTAVVSEAFVRLAGREEDKSFDTEAHLLAYAATTMRAILVDHARRRMSKKRGHGGSRSIEAVPMELIASGVDASVDVLEIDDALRALEAADARAARVVEARVFGGLTIEEVAEVMGVSLSSVSRDWRFGRAFLAEQLCDHRSQACDPSPSGAVG